MPTSTSIIEEQNDRPELVTPEEHDEAWAGGHMPGTRSDDSVDEITDDMDLYQGDDDVAEEVDIAQEVNTAERNRHFDAEGE